jgi:hypothetical protein
MFIHGGQSLEFINQYGQLTNFLLDYTLSRSQKAGLSAMIGANPYTNVVVNELSAGVVNYGGTSTTAGVCQTDGDRTGLSIATTTAIATSPVYNFCLPIMSGIIGANSPKTLPISALGSPFRVEYFLSANDDAIFYCLGGAGAVWQMMNVELELCYVNIDIQEDLIPRNEPIYISTSTYRQAS